MNVTTWHIDHAGTVFLLGEVDMSAMVDLRTVLVRHPQTNIVDCSGVTFIDAAGLDALISTDERTVRIVHPSATVTRLIHLLDRHADWCRKGRVLIDAG